MKHRVILGTNWETSGLNIWGSLAPEFSSPPLQVTLHTGRCHLEKVCIYHHLSLSLQTTNKCSPTVINSSVYILIVYYVCIYPIRPLHLRSFSACHIKGACRTSASPSSESPYTRIPVIGLKHRQPRLRSSCGVIGLWLMGGPSCEAKSPIYVMGDSSLRHQLFKCLTWWHVHC